MVCINTIYNHIIWQVTSIIYDRRSVFEVSWNTSFYNLVNPFFTKEGKNIKVSTCVKYIDQQTKAIQISQYNLTLREG